MLNALTDFKDRVSLPHVVKVGLFHQAYGLRRWNHEVVRENVKRVNRDATGQRIQRSEAAHVNGFETYPIFASSVLLAHFQQVSTPVLSSLCTLYVLS